MQGVANIVEILIDQRLYKMADFLSVQHMIADIHEVPVFQTNEYDNKLTGYLGQIGFQQFLMTKNIKHPILKINLDGKSDTHDFEVRDKKIDVKTLLWADYWKNNTHSSWSFETGKISDKSELLAKFFLLIPQLQIGLDDSLNPALNYRKKKTGLKDIYWAVFIEKNAGDFYGGKIYICGWCTMDDLIKANSARQYFRFSNKMHTNIAIPLKDLRPNEQYFV